MLKGLRYKILGIAVFATSVAILAYAKWVEPYWLRIQTVPIDLTSANAPSKKILIAHLSDLHFSKAVGLEYLERAFRETVRQNPDFICLTGDYISDRLAKPDDYSRVLRILSDHAPTFACPGNHDGGLWAKERGGYADLNVIKQLMQRSGIVFLENESARIEIRQLAVLVGGLGDLWAGRLDADALRTSMNGANADFKILLTHNPDSKVWLRDVSRDILLCGHTHGGQFDMPFLGTPFAPIRDMKYVNGLYEFDGGKIYADALQIMRNTCATGHSPRSARSCLTLPRLTSPQRTVRSPYPNSPHSTTNRSSRRGGFGT